MAASTSVEVFVFVRGQFLGSRIFPAGRMISIGRAPESSVVLDDPAVSSRHAVLYVEGGKLVVADNQSRNGIQVNGQPVTTCAIGPLDEITIGECRLKAELVAPPAPAPASFNAERTQAGAALPTFAAGGTDPDGSGLPQPQPPAPRAAPRAPARAAAAAGPGLAARPAPPELVDEDPITDVSAIPAARAREERQRVGGRAEPQRPEPQRPEPARPARPVARPEPPPPEPPRAAAQRPVAEPARPATPQARPPPPPAPTPLPPPTAGPDTNEELLPSSSEQELPSVIAGELEEPQADGVLPPLGDDEHDEEELEERNFQPSFSLLENVVRDRFKQPAHCESRPVVEVLRYRGDRLLDVARLEKGRSYEVVEAEEGSPQRSSTLRLLQVRGEGKARLFFTTAMQGSLVVGGHSVALGQLCDQAHLIDAKRQVYAADIGEADYAHVKVGGGGHLFRFVRAPVHPKRDFNFSVSAEERLYVALGFGGVILMMIGIWLQALIAPPKLIMMEEAEFAEVSLKDLELEKPEEPKPPEPPPPEPPPVVAAPPDPAPQPPQPRPKTPQPKVAKNTPAPPAPSAAQNQASNALAALDNIVPASNHSLSAAVSNIAAVKAPSGTASSFAVSGAIGKIPGNEVALASGARGGRDTRAAATLLAGSSAGKLTGGGGTGQVRGVVTRPPPRSIGTAGGTLDRAEILKVVNAGISDVQRCYERQLLKSQGLSGKIVFDWTIDPGGKVTSARVRSSTLASQEVASCISGVIKGWRFPKPTGGSVIVTFPFVFSGQSF